VLVDGLAGQPGIALARIWLIAPGDICSSSCLVRAASRSAAPSVVWPLSWPPPRATVATSCFSTPGRRARSFW